MDRSAGSGTYRWHRLLPNGAEPAGRGARGGVGANGVLLVSTWKTPTRLPGTPEPKITAAWERRPRSPATSPTQYLAAAEDDRKPWRRATVRAPGEVRVKAQHARFRLRDPRVSEDSACSSVSREPEKRGAGSRRGCPLGRGGRPRPSLHLSRGEGEGHKERSRA